MTRSFSELDLSMKDLEVLSRAEDFIGAKVEGRGGMSRVCGHSIPNPVEIVGRVIAVEVNVVKGLDR